MRQKETRLLLLPLVALLSGCLTDSSNPCPAGHEPFQPERRCVPVSGRVPPVLLDTGPTLDTSPPPPMCAQDDVDSWQAFHKLEGLNTTIGLCYAGCSEDDESCLFDCVIGNSGLDGCVTCAQREGECLQGNCWLACSPHAEDPVCHACLCEAGCTAAFDDCAGRNLNLCTGVHGSEPVPGEETPSHPLVMRNRSSNGYRVVEEFGPEADGLTRSSSTHWSVNWNHALTFEHEGQSYLLQHKSRCGSEPCLARLSPVHADGSLGPPLYEDTWTRGWDEVELVPQGKRLLLVRYKTGSEPADGPPNGSLRVEWLVWGKNGVSLEQALETTWYSQANIPWAGIETFALDGVSYVLRHAQQSGTEAEVVRLDGSEDDITVSPVLGSVRWSTGWDVIRTFPVDDDWYVIRYKTGTLPTGGESAGSLRIARLIKSGAEIKIGPDLHAAEWPAGKANIVPFRTVEGAFLLVHWLVPPYAYRILRLQLSTMGVVEGLSSPAVSGEWGGTRPWDVVTVTPNHRWQFP